MDIVASWTRELCIEMSQGQTHNHINDVKSEPAEYTDDDLSGWNVLDLGTGNDLLLQELSKQGFSDLTGTDYSGGAVDLARSLALRDGFATIIFFVDDVLEANLEMQFRLVVDKGTLDAIGFSLDGPIKRIGPNPNMVTRYIMTLTWPPSFRKVKGFSAESCQHQWVAHGVWELAPTNKMPLPIGINLQPCGSFGDFLEDFSLLYEPKNKYDYNQHYWGEYERHGKFLKRKNMEMTPCEN